MHANALSTRRALVAQAGSSAVAAVSNPEAALLEMVAALAAAEDRRRAFGIAIDERMDRCAYPPSPTALHFRPSDRPNICDDPEEHCELHAAPGGRDVRVYRDQTALTPQAQAVWNSGGAIVDLSFAKADRARILEMKAAYERWQADIARAEDEAGMTEPVRLYERESEIVDELLRKISATPAMTLEGLAAKGRAAALATGSPLAALEGQLVTLLSKPDARKRDVASMSFMVDAMRLAVGLPVLPAA